MVSGAAVVAVSVMGIAAGVGGHIIPRCILNVDTMVNETTIAKWGNSLAVRIPLPIARQAGLSNGDLVEMHFGEDGGIVLRPARKRYQLSELVGRITPRNCHKQTVWGAPTGEESW